MNVVDIKHLVSKSQIFKVEFVKKNGDRRIMLASNKPEIISKFIVSQPKDSEKRQNPDVCTVVDLEKREFRCFRWDSVQNIQIIR